MVTLLSIIYQAYEERWTRILDIHRTYVRTSTKTCSLLSVIHKKDELVYHSTIAYKCLINCISILLTKALSKVLRPLIEQKHLDSTSISLSFCYKIDKRHVNRDKISTKKVLLTTTY